MAGTDMVGLHRCTTCDGSLDAIDNPFAPLVRDGSEFAPDHVRTWLELVIGITIDMLEYRCLARAHT